MSMTALQDWLNIRPVDPFGLRCAIREVIRGLSADETEVTAEPAVMSRGLERC
jgi:hypothetical protein